MDGQINYKMYLLTELEYFNLVLSSLAKDTSRVGLQKGNVHVYLGLSCSLTVHPGLTVTIGELMEYSYFLFPLDPMLVTE